MQGVAEVVPVSSSAQLALLPELLGWDEPADRTTFAAGLHAGSSLGMAWALRRDLTPRTLLTLGAGSIPAAVAGLLAADAVEERLGTRRQLAALLAGAGVLLWAADHADERHGVRRSDAVAAAIAQVAALVPGVSRSGATLIALRARHVDRAAAQRHSLLTSLPVSAGAAALTLLRADLPTLRRLAPGLLAGIPVAAVVAAGSTSGQLRRGTTPVRAAALYRLGLAVVLGVRHLREKS